MGRLLLLAILLISISCNTTRKPKLDEGKDVQLESCRWNLMELYGKKVGNPEGGKPIYLDFTHGDNVISGNGGCNSLNGMYTVHDDLIKLQKMSATEMACEDAAVTSTEKLFMQLLEETERYKISVKTEDGIRKHQLTLYKAKDPLAIFIEDKK